MRWMNRIWRWGPLSIAVVALGGGLIAGKQWAETRALSTVLGAGAEASAMKVHWSKLTGCVENVAIPLAHSNDRDCNSARLTADRLWFTYDLPSLLRKRLLLPRVIIEDALIETRPWASSRPPSDNSAFGSGGDASNAAVTWLADLRKRIESLEQDQFISGTQVAVDTAMLAEQWQADFAGVRDRAHKVLHEARDIQQQLAALNNVLRHEKQVISSRDRLEVLRATLMGMKIDLSRNDRTLRDQQSRVREALLIEKTALHEQGLAFRAPEAHDVALCAVEQWMLACLHEPTRTSRLLADIINKPYLQTRALRGANIRYSDQQAAEFEVLSAKISGDIMLGERSTPFTASGNFRLMPVATATQSSASQEESHWQMLVGSPTVTLSLDGHRSQTRSGMVEMSFRSNAPGQLQAKCELGNDVMQGSGQLQLRQWLSETSERDDIASRSKPDPLMEELLHESLSRPELKKVPEVIQFQFSGSADKPRLELSDNATRWLSDELTRLASERVAQRYDAASERLETRIHRDLEDLTRQIAHSRNETVAQINLLLDELRTVQANVLNNLQQRGGAHFARRVSDGLVN